MSGVRDGGYGAANKRQRVTSSEETVLYLECAIGYTNQHMWWNCIEINTHKMSACKTSEI